MNNLLVTATLFLFLFSLSSSLFGRSSRKKSLFGGIFKGKNYKSKEERKREEYKRRLQITSKRPDKVTLEEEMEIGQSLTRKYLDALDGELISSYYYKKPWDYCNAIADAVGAKLWSRKERKYRVGIVRSKTPEVFSTPGGFIVITTALLEKLESEGQLVALIAFEAILISRQVHLHAYHRGARNKSKSKALGSLLSGGRSRSSLGAYNTGEINVIEGRFGKDNVLEADKCAATIMAYLGYSPVSYEIYLHTLKEIQPAMLRSNMPSVDERLAKLKQYVEGNVAWANGFAQDRKRYKKKVLDKLPILPGLKN